MRTIVLTLGARHSSGHGWQSLSLGSNLDQSVGLAIAAKLLNRNYEVVTCLSDGELQCGVDHQAKLAAAWHLNNLIVLLDNNGLQSNYEVQRVDGTLEGGRAGPRLRALWENYGWDYIEIDGHRYAEIVEAFHFAQRSSRPVIIVAKTLKGKGVPRFEGKFGYDHLASDQEIAEAEAHLKSLVLNKRAAKRLEGPRLDMEPTQAVRSTVVLPNLDARDMSSERMAVPLERWLSQFRDLNPGRVVLLNTDNPVPFDRSTPVYGFGVASRHLFAGINEKAAVGIGRGLANEGMLPIYLAPAVHLQACGEEFIHLGLDRQVLLVIGFYPGLDLSHWGLSHAGFRDIALFSAPGVSVFQAAGPQDVSAILDSIYMAPDQWLPAYVRIPRRGRTDLLVRAGLDSLPPLKMGFYVVGSMQDVDCDAVLIASGRATSECVEAADNLNKIGISTKVINVFNLREVDSTSFQRAVGKPRALISCIEADPIVFQATLLRAMDPSRRALLLSLGLTGAPRGFDREGVLRQFHMHSDQLISAVIDRVNDAPK